MSGRKSSAKKNFAYQLAYEALIVLLPIATSPYISRVIGAEGLGIYSYSYSAAYYFVLFSMLGLKNYGSRTIAQCRDDPAELNETFSGILTVHVTVSLLCCAAYAAYLGVIKENRLYALIQGALVLGGLFDVSWFFFGIEQFKQPVVRNIAVKILGTICIFLFVRTADDLWIYCLIMSAGFFLNQASLWIPLRKYVRYTRPDWGSMRRHIKPLVVLFLPTVAVSLYKYMDKIMLGAISSKTQLGFYENAEKAANVLITVISAFGTVMLPKMSHLMHSNGKGAMRYIALSMRYVMCLAFALAFGAAGVGGVFAPVFWGEGFRTAGALITGLSITIPFLAFANVIRTQFLIPAEKDGEYLCSVTAGAVVNLCINCVLIPSRGAAGAVAGTIAAEVTVCLVQMWEVRKYLPLGSYIKNAVPFFLTGLAMFIAVRFYGRSRPASAAVLAAQIGIGTAIYGAASLVCLLAVRDEILTAAVRRMRSLF